MTAYPYTDDYMTYDYDTHRYILTQKDVSENLGIDLTARIKAPNAINALLKQVSTQIYNFIHSHNVANEFQDFIIAKTYKGRAVIREAMEQQLIYFLAVGDLSRSTDREKRALAIDENAKNVLLQPIPEIGTTILYSGRFRVNVILSQFTDDRW